MKKIFIAKGIFSTIRFPNLVIICLSLYLVRYFIVKPILGYSGQVSSITDSAYLLLVLGTLFIAAAGYVINDYFDVAIDAINKPGKNKTGTIISKKTAIGLYIVLNIAGLAASWYFGFMQGIRYPVLVFFLSAGMLYFYSSSYKKMLLVGNVVISFLAALTIGLSILFDREALISEPVKLLVTAYALFGFFMTFIREIIKDCEDARGDSMFGSNSFPLVAGINTARITVAVLTAVLLGNIIYIQMIQMQWQNMTSFVYTILCIQTPLLYLVVKSLMAKNPMDDRRNSMVAKIIMVTGLFSMVIFHLSSG